MFHFQNKKQSIWFGHPDLPQGAGGCGAGAGAAVLLGRSSSTQGNLIWVVRAT